MRRARQSSCWMEENKKGTLASPTETFLCFEVRRNLWLTRSQGYRLLNAFVAQREYPNVLGSLDSHNWHSASRCLEHTHAILSETSYSSAGSWTHIDCLHKRISDIAADQRASVTTK